MSRNELNVLLAAVVTTALECQRCPESMVYIALGSDMGKYETVKAVLLAGKLATFGGNSITLTATGREIAEKCNACRVRS